MIESAYIYKILWRSRTELIHVSVSSMLYKSEENAKQAGNIKLDHLKQCVGEDVSLKLEIEILGIEK